MLNLLPTRKRPGDISEPPGQNRVTEHQSGLYNSVRNSPLENGKFKVNLDLQLILLFRTLDHNRNNNHNYFYEQSLNSQY